MSDLSEHLGFSRVRAHSELPKACPGRSIPATLPDICEANHTFTLRTVVRCRAIGLIRITPQHDARAGAVRVGIPSAHTAGQVPCPSRTART